MAADTEEAGTGMSKATAGTVTLPTPAPPTARTLLSTARILHSTAPTPGTATCRAPTLRTPRHMEGTWDRTTPAMAAAAAGVTTAASTRAACSAAESGSEAASSTYTIRAHQLSALLHLRICTSMSINHVAYAYIYIPN
uniref:Uncharacterized protein n=1 Tax=Oryza glumipatula TaxID=40148 RepID=A0A0D9Y3G4_9ORYZ